ncbi:hypothetical protein MF672_006270 [Actinomadura sp. ATCC 31491]|uniref:PASTA domain-containing protein n=1 Tax=Actinomadura luzonensis TaxID=2805427 RepID=A0ABT0FM54_9ACTN|nr:hypothetical protein [Actinomadura luzonensis]MCK2213400.1 hypothetical protein [Actinomadura luzonensis]
MHEIDRLVAGIAPDPGPGMTPIARELLEEITSVPVPERRRRRGWLAVPRPRRWAAVPALAALAALLSFGVAQAPASAALDIERVGDHYVITVQDLLAEPAVYQRELRARGLDITLDVVPTSASLTGQIIVISDLDRLRSGQMVSGEGPITTIDAPGPCERFTGCPIGVKVPVGFDKKAAITLGRRALPGERYQMPPGIALPGEPLHCVAYVGKSVAEVSALLRERGVTPSYVSAGKRAVPSAPGDWYVHDGVMSADGQALLLVGPERADRPAPQSPC